MFACVVRVETEGIPFPVQGAPAHAARPFSAEMVRDGPAHGVTIQAWQRLSRSAREAVVAEAESLPLPDTVHPFGVVPKLEAVMPDSLSDAVTVKVFDPVFLNRTVVPLA